MSRLKQPSAAWNSCCFDWTSAPYPPESVCRYRSCRLTVARVAYFQRKRGVLPGDITVQELRIDAFHPADRLTEEFVIRTAGLASQADRDVTGFESKPFLKGARVLGPG